MTPNIRNLYFEWLLSFVYDDRYYQSTPYRRLLSYLHSRPFYYISTMVMDENRASDGTDLRYRFGMEMNIPASEIAEELDIFECSILEMMVALAIRMEEHIMGDAEIGDRTGQWFWEMIRSLKLDSMHDRNFDISYVNNVLYNFLERRYSPNGEGGLFTVANPKEDLRQVEIWYQMNQYLIEQP